MQLIAEEYSGAGSVTARSSGDTTRRSLSDIRLKYCQMKKESQTIEHGSNVKKASHESGEWRLKETESNNTTQQEGGHLIKSLKKSPPAVLSRLLSNDNDLDQGRKVQQ